MKFEAQDVLIGAADLSKLNQWVLYAASKGDSLAQDRGIVPEFILENECQKSARYFAEALLLEK